MSIMDRLFGAKTAEPVQQQPQQVNPLAVAANATVPTPNAPGPDGSMPAFPKVDNGTKSPMAEYAELFNPPKEGEQQGGIPRAVPTFALDPAKLNSVAQTIDFTSGISAEKLSAAFPGGDQEVMKEILNSIGRESFRQNFSIGVKTVESAMTEQTNNLTSKTIPELLRRNEIGSLNRSASTLFSDPATKPVMEMLETQFANKYPAASPQQIRDYTADHFNKMVGVSVKEQGMEMVKRPEQTQNKEIDWDQWSGLSGQPN